MEKSKGRAGAYIALHILLVVYSFSTVCSKLAGKQEFLSFKFCLFYGLVIMLLGIYAIVWQQIIKRLPLTTAFANKAVTVVWGIIWGFLIFHESITIGKVVGAFFVIAGVIIFALSDENNKQDAVKEESANE